MIRVTFFHQEQRLIGFTSVGHAGYAEAGRDILCSAVSSLLYAVANTLDERDALLYAEVDEQKGSMSIRVKKDAERIATEAILQVARVGIEGIVEQYGQFVSMNMKEE